MYLSGFKTIKRALYTLRLTPPPHLQSHKSLNPLLPSLPPLPGRGFLYYTGLSMNKRILILGLGNILISDEGLGVHALRWLEANCKLPPEVELVDGGTGGLSLLPLLASIDMLIVIDAITLGKEPGTIYCFSEEILTNQSLLEKISTHEISFADILSILQLKGDKPKRVFLLGIEPKSLEVGTELSEEVKKNIPKLCQLVLEKINESMP